MADPTAQLVNAWVDLSAVAVGSVQGAVFAVSHNETDEGPDST